MVRLVLFPNADKSMSIEEVYETEDGQWLFEGNDGDVKFHPLKLTLLLKKFPNKAQSFKFRNCMTIPLQHPKGQLVIVNSTENILTQGIWNRIEEIMTEKDVMDKLVTTLKEKYNSAATTTTEEEKNRVKADIETIISSVVDRIFGIRGRQYKPL